MYDFLKKVPFFADLSDADIAHLTEDSTEIHAAAGDYLFKEGDEGDEAYVIKEGQLEVLKESSGRDVLLAVRETSDVIGEMALLEESPRMATVRARTESVLIAISKEQLDHLLATSVSAARAMFYTILGRWRGTETMLRQSEKMAQLGTLTAGVAHELNNPAAAVKRGADQLADAVLELNGAQMRLDKLVSNEEVVEALRSVDQQVRESATRPPELDAMARSDREYDLEGWLEEHNVEDGWELAPTLVNLNYPDTELDALAERFGPEILPSVLAWMSASYTVHNVLTEIGQGASRMSDIVKALKSYSYLDQAPVQAVNIHEGLDNTLMILKSKLQNGISVRREYAPDLPVIQGYGSELNQVWTNLLDNAADALEGKGEITIRTRSGEQDSVFVDVEDNGPGIPLEIQSKVFDSFFTTKPPGKGTGLGLDISYNIVVSKHRGDMKLFSEPGATRFEVRLPVNFEAS